MMTSAIFKWKTVQSLIGRQRCCWFLLDIIWKKIWIWSPFFMWKHKKYLLLCVPPPRVLIVHRWFLLRVTLWHSWSLFLYWVIITDDLGTKIGQERSSECVCMCVCVRFRKCRSKALTASQCQVCVHICVYVHVWDRRQRGGGGGERVSQPVRSTVD